MRAISLWQPYAQLIAEGLKVIETRSWPTNVRGRIAIHATKRKPDVFFPVLDGKDIPLGAIVGTAEIIDCFPIERLYGGAFDTPEERSYGDWNQGRYGWVLTGVVRFESPVHINGHQGFWEWEQDTVDL